MRYPLDLLPGGGASPDLLDVWRARALWPVVSFTTPEGERVLACGTAARAESLAPSDDWQRELRAHITTLRGGELCALCDEGPPALVTIPFDPSRAHDARWGALARVAVHVPMLAIVTGGRHDGIFTSSEHMNASSIVACCTAPDDARPVPDADDDHAPASPASYPDAVRAALARITAGEAEKIVVAREAEESFPRHTRLAPLVRSLAAEHPSSYNILIAESENRIFMSVTPERLARVERHELRTEAVAGTLVGGDADAACAGDAAPFDDKTAREHEAVVRMITGALGGICSSVGTGARGLRRVGDVRHVVTPIAGALAKGADLVDAMAALHPTPAVAGTPRAASLAAIGAIEHFDRGLYAGVVALIDARGDGDAAVALRSALVTGGRVVLHAGAGIVAGSDPSAEERETDAKLGAMRAVLARAASDA
jgi:salicylate biosynthesis isochorismate synthase